MDEGPRREIDDIFNKRDIAAWPSQDLRPSTAPTACCFELSAYAPVAMKRGRAHPRYREEAKDQLKEMLNAGVISHSTSPWAFPLVPDAKPDGAQRLCVSFRPLNSRMPKDAWPMPDADELLQSLDGAVFCATLDLFLGVRPLCLRAKEKQLLFLKWSQRAQRDYKKLGAASGIFYFLNYKIHKISN